MSEHNPIVENFFESGNDLYLNEFYYIAFGDQKFMAEFRGELTEKEFNDRYARYMAITTWPENNVKFKALAEIHPEDNPNYIKITGRQIVNWTEQGFVPQFDHDFRNTRKLVMIPLEAYEYYARYSKAGGKK